MESLIRHWRPVLVYLAITLAIFSAAVLTHEHVSTKTTLILFGAAGVLLAPVALIIGIAVLMSGPSTQRSSAAPAQLAVQQVPATPKRKPCDLCNGTALATDHDAMERAGKVGVWDSDRIKKPCPRLSDDRWDCTSRAK